MPNVTATEHREEFAKSVCLFLAEQIRIRKITLKRAAEIAQKVVAHMNLLDTEHDFLQLIKELTKDFDELVKLEEHVFLHAKMSERNDMEHHVKDFVVSILSRDSKLALQILTDATADGADYQKLLEKFPEFNDYMSRQK